jgi:transposase InsO family protein
VSRLFTVSPAFHRTRNRKEHLSHNQSHKVGSDVRRWCRALILSSRRHSWPFTIGQARGRFSIGGAFTAAVSKFARDRYMLLVVLNCAAVEYLTRLVLAIALLS